MQLLLVHADRLEFESTGPAGEERDDESRGAHGECLVALASVEEGDGAATEQVAADGAQVILKHAQAVGAPLVVLYPYAHLSPSLETPRTARKVLDALAAQLEQGDPEFARAPFGWYKSFRLECKGHPLAELSRRIVPGADGEVATALEAEEAVQSEFHLLHPDGSLEPVGDAKLDRRSPLARMVGYETDKQRAAKQEPPHIKLMQQLELVDHEPGSDKGNLRWYPKGVLIKRLLEEKVGRLVRSAGAMEVETPEMYDYHHPCMEKYLARFPARQYRLLSGDKPYFMRFAACFGQFLIASDAQISYRHLPLRLYELAHSSYRREKSGELAGLRRLRSFTMPDMHTLVGDLPQGLEEFGYQYRLSMEWMNSLGVPYEAAMRAQQEFFDENRDFYTGLAKVLGRPMLLELFDRRYAYFITKFEFNVIDTQGKAAAMSTVQIDVENGKRFNIEYVDHDGSRRHPYVLHTSLSGSIDRNLYALLEHAAAEMARGAKPQLPFWLAPTQLRLLPVSTAHADHCLELAQTLAAAGFRVDVDDRDAGVGRKVRDGEKEWVPLMAVYGEKEAASGKLALRDRTGGQSELSPEALQALLEERQGEEPRRPLPLPVRLSLRPRFYG